MKLFRKTLAAFLTVLLVMSLIGPAFAAAKATATTMKLQSISGTVSITKSTGKSVKYTAGMTLYSGYTVTTGKKSYANISVDGTKVLKVDASSSVSLSKSGKKLNLFVNSGSAYFNVTKKLSGDESMNIQTSTMTTGIRGTVGVVTVPRDGAAGSATLSLLEGSVNVVLNNSAGISAVPVSAGQAVSVAANPGSLPTVPAPVTLKTENIPGFVAVEIAADPTLKDRLEQSVGNVINVSTITEQAQQKLEQEQAQEERLLQELERRLKEEVKKSVPQPTKPVEPSGGGGGGSYTSYDYLVTMADGTVNSYTAEQSFTVPAHATLKLLTNVGSSSSAKELLVQAPADGDTDVTETSIDLNGFTFYGTVTADKSSTLDILDATSGKNGKICGTVTVDTGAAVSINGTTVDAADAAALSIQGGTVTLSGATIKNDSVTNAYSDPDSPAPTPLIGYPTVSIASGARLKISGENSVSNNSSGLVIVDANGAASGVLFDETAYGCLNVKTPKAADASTPPYHHLMSWLSAALAGAQYEDTRDSSHWGVAYFNKNYSLTRGGDTTYGLWTDGSAPALADGDTLILLRDIDLASGVSGPLLEIPAPVPVNEEPLAATGVTLDLNGRMLKGSSGGAVVSVKANAKLIVTDSSDKQTGTIENAYNTSNPDSNPAYAVKCANGGSFEINSGSLKTGGNSSNLYNNADGSDISTCIKAAATLKHKAPDALTLKVYAQPKPGNLDLSTLFADFNAAPDTTACYVDLYADCNMNSPFSIGKNKGFDLNGHGKTIIYAGSGTAFTLGDDATIPESCDTESIERYIRNVTIETVSQTLLKVAQGTVFLGGASLTNNSAENPTVIIASGKALGSTGSTVTNTITNDSTTGRAAEREEGEHESVGSFCGVILRVAKGGTTTEADARDRIGTSEGTLGMSPDEKYWMTTISSGG